VINLLSTNDAYLQMLYTRDFSVTIKHCWTESFTVYSGLVTQAVTSRYSPINCTIKATQVHSTNSILQQNLSPAYCQQIPNKLESKNTQNALTQLCKSINFRNAVGQIRNSWAKKQISGKPMI